MLNLCAKTFNYSFFSISCFLMVRVLMDPVLNLWTPCMRWECRSITEHHVLTHWPRDSWAKAVHSPPCFSEVSTQIFFFHLHNETTGFFAVRLHSRNKTSKPKLMQIFKLSLILNSWQRKRGREEDSEA